MLNLPAGRRGRAGKLKVSKLSLCLLGHSSGFNTALAGLAQRQRGRLGSRRIFLGDPFLASGSWVGGVVVGLGSPGAPEVLLGETCFLTVSIVWMADTVPASHL